LLVDSVERDKVHSAVKSYWSLCHGHLKLKYITLKCTLPGVKKHQTFMPSSCITLKVDGTKVVSHSFKTDCIQFKSLTLQKERLSSNKFHPEQWECEYIYTLYSTNAIHEQDIL